MVTEKKVWEILEQVSDPEIPVLTIADLGIIRSIDKIDNSFKITITPTYSGCPAMRVIESEIEAALASEGITNIIIETILSPAWTTDWLSENGRKKLAEPKQINTTGSAKYNQLYYTEKRVSIARRRLIKKLENGEYVSSKMLLKYGLATAE